MPGVGKPFEPSLDVLRGIALRSELISNDISELSSSVFSKKNIHINTTKSKSPSSKEETSQICLKYFPEQRLSLNAQSRFRALFQEKEQWELKELDPYLDPLVKGFGGGGEVKSNEKQIKAELLLQHTCTVADSEGITWYRSR